MYSDVLNLRQIPRCTLGYGSVVGLGCARPCLYVNFASTTTTGYRTDGRPSRYAERNSKVQARHA